MLRLEDNRCIGLKRTGRDDMDYLCQDREALVDTCSRNVGNFLLCTMKLYIYLVRPPVI